MTKPRNRTEPRKLLGQLQLARFQLAKAESSLEAAKERARLARRKRKEAKQAARRAKKNVKAVKVELCEAKEALAKIQARMAEAAKVAARKRTVGRGVSVKEPRNIPRPKTKKTKPAARPGMPTPVTPVASPVTTPRAQGAAEVSITKQQTATQSSGLSGAQGMGA